jgi:MraZ protein
MDATDDADRASEGGGDDPLGPHAAPPAGIGDDDLLFAGRWSATLDDKGRIVIPVKVREAIEGSRQPLSFFLGRGPGKNLGFDPARCLVLYDRRNFARVRRRVAEKLPQNDPARQDFERVFYPFLEMVDCDKAGRIMISDELRKYAGIEREVLIAGANQRLEIWNPATWNRVLASMDVSGFEDVARSAF